MHENSMTKTGRPAAANEAAAAPPADATRPGPSRDILTEILHDGAQRLLAQAIDAEVADWIDRHADVVGDDGRRQVVRNGHHPARTILTGVGPLAVTQPRVHDRRIAGVDDAGQAIDRAGQPVARFRSSILPPYLRKTKALEELIPWLYLKGVSTGGFTEALQALVGPQQSVAKVWSTQGKRCFQRENHRRDARATLLPRAARRPG